MRSFKTRIAVSVLIVMAVTAPLFLRAQEQESRPIKYVRGRICDINWAGSKITIQWFYSTDELSEDKMTFTTSNVVRVFTDRGKIFKDVRPAGITDLIKGDHVIIGYRDKNKKAQLEAVTIRVLEHDTPIPP